MSKSMHILSVLTYFQIDLEKSYSRLSVSSQLMGTQLSLFLLLHPIILWLPVNFPCPKHLSFGTSSKEALNSSVRAP